eukprot:1412621-Pyramimonas_sp.AAC.1
MGAIRSPSDLHVSMPILFAIPFGLPLFAPSRLSYFLWQSAVVDIAYHALGSSTDDVFHAAVTAVQPWLTSVHPR